MEKPTANSRPLKLIGPFFWSNYKSRLAFFIGPHPDSTFPVLNAGFLGEGYCRLVPIKQGD